MSRSLAQFMLFVVGLASICSCSNSGGAQIKSEKYKLLSESEKQFANITTSVLYGNLRSKNLFGSKIDLRNGIIFKGRCFKNVNISIRYEFRDIVNFGSGVSYHDLYQCRQKSKFVEDSGYHSDSIARAKTLPIEFIDQSILYAIGYSDVTDVDSSAGYTKFASGYFSRQSHCKLYQKTHPSGRRIAIVLASPSDGAKLQKLLSQSTPEQYLEQDSRLAECFLRSAMIATDLEGGATLSDSLITPSPAPDGYKPCQREKALELYQLERTAPYLVNRERTQDVAKSRIACRVPPKPTMYAIAVIGRILSGLEKQPEMLPSEAFRELVAGHLLALEPYQRRNLVEPFRYPVPGTPPPEPPRPALRPTPEP
jgi:hypothetical protein